MLRIPSRTLGSGRVARRPALARAALLGAIFALAALLSTANAFAASGAPINIGTPFQSGPPSVAVDSTGTAYIAWANEKDLPPATTNFVQYCVLPAGAAACSHTGSLTPADNGQYIDGVHVLLDGSTLVVLADVYGTSGSAASEYEPEQEWQSTDGGATFNLVNAGKSVTDGILSADTGPLNAVVVPGTNVLGFGWDSAAGNETYDAVPTFNAFPLTSPPECSIKMCAAGFAALEPNTNPDPIGNPFIGQFASQSGAAPGVLGIFETNFSNGPLACLPGFGTAYAYGSGDQSAGNSYNISPGTANSAWRVPIAQADCNVAYPAITGGPSGFGVLEDDTAHNNIVYHRFDQATDAFDTPYATIAANREEQDPAVSEDGAGGLYATFLLGGGGGPIDLAYSYDGGTSWVGPGTLNPNADRGAGEVTSSVGPSGQGWAAWIDNGSVYAQQFDAADAIAAPAPTALTTSQTAGADTGPYITIAPGTVGETDRATITGANAASATGTVTYGLYSKSDCSAASKVLDAGTVAVTGGVAAASSPVTAALAPGTYYWLASYSGNAGSVTGAKGNQASASACGSEALTVGLPPAPSSEFKVEAIVTSSEGTITITIVVTQPGEATLTVTISTSKLAHAAAVEAKRSKKCRHGQIELKGKCVPAATVVGKTSAKAPAAGPLKLTVHLSHKVRALLRKGKTVHLTGKLTFQSALGGEPTTHTYSIAVKGHRKHKH